MQKKILVTFLTILFFGVVGILYGFLNYTDEDIVQTKEYLSPIDKKEKRENLSKSWIDALVKNRGSRFQYPVNELYMHIDLQKYIPPKIKSYRLIIQNGDRYSLFCVVQTLQNFKMPFVITKQKAVPLIYMGSSSISRLKKIEKKLKIYGINSKIIEE